MFISPAFLLAAAAGAAVPLLLHFLRRKRTVRIDFPTIRFLQLADEQSSRRIRMEHFLLWLLRTLIMILLGFAFAMPMLRRSQLNWLGEAPRDVALVLDTSYSMGYSTGRQTIWDKALEAAAAVIEGLGENDRFCLYLAGEQSQALIAAPIGDKEEGLSRLKGLEIAHASSQLAPAVVAAYEALVKDAPQREREIHVFTDNQALPWARFGTAGETEPGTPPEPEAEEAIDGEDNLAGGPTPTAAWDPGRLDPRTTVFVSLLGVRAPENAGIADADLQPPFLLKGSSARVTTTLGYSGISKSTTVTLWVDDEEVSRRSTLLGSVSSGQLEFTLPPLSPGTHTARLETPEDNLVEDNAFHFLVRVKDELPALCIGTADDTLFLRAALQAGTAKGSGVQAKWFTPEQAARESLDGYACIFLCNALPVPGELLTALETYTRNGGLLAIFPGVRAVPEDYRAWTSLPALPTVMQDVPRAERSRTLSWDLPRHPILLPLREALAVPNLTIRRELTWEYQYEDTVRLISSGAEKPFMLGRPNGRGQTFLFAVSADRTWSNLPLSPFYLPIIHQLVEHGAGMGGFTPFLWGATAVPLGEVLPEASRETVLKDPDGRAVPIRSAVMEGRTILHAEDLTRPGIYRLSAREQPVDLPALAINTDRQEADLTPIDPAALPGLTGLDQLYLASDREELQRLIQDHRIGRTYGEHLLWVVLLLAIAEFFYANWLLRSRPSLSSRLGMEASGKLRGHILLPGLFSKGKADA